MDVRVTIVETKTIERTYYVSGVNSLEAAGKCAERCAGRRFQPNTYMWREVPKPPTYHLEKYEVVES